MKKNNPARRAGEKNNLAPIWSEKNILARTKNPSPPPLNIKWTVPNKIAFSFYSSFLSIRYFELRRSNKVIN